MKTIINKSIKNLSKTIVITSALATIASPAIAAGYKSSSHSSIEYARVVGVTPVVESYQVNNPIEQCWDERVRTNKRASRSHTPELIGGLIGAAIGHKFGRGRGQDVATAAGAVLGASVAHDVKNKNRRYQGSTYQVVQRCEIRDSYTTHERVVGYDVAYRFNGKVFNTQMGQHPGKKIRVNVSVTPA